MRTRIDSITFASGTRSIDTGIADLKIEDIRLIVNETQKVVICSSMQKDNVVSIADGVVTYKETIAVLAEGDAITFEVDKGADYPSVASLATEVASGKAMIAEAITSKGGAASATESLHQLATDIINLDSTTDFLKMVCERDYLSASDIDNPIRAITHCDSESVARVGQNAFSNCGNLTYVNLPNCTSIGDNCFSKCSSLEVLSTGVTYINGYKATGCSNLKRLKFGTLTQVGPFAQNLEFDKLIDVEIGHGTDIDLPCFSTRGQIRWTASNYLTTSQEQWPDRLALYTNLYNHLIKRLYDHSSDGVVRLLRIAYYSSLYADSVLETEPYGSYYTPLIKQAAIDCIAEVGRRNWTISD